MEHSDIRDKLDEYEDEYDVDVLVAKDFGSKAWNLDSKWSDHDIAFVFTQKPFDYLLLGGYRQNIDRKFEGPDGIEHSAMGWNVKRFAELVNKSNPTALEFLKSDLTYLSPHPIRQRAVDDFWQHVKNHFKPIAMMGHYHSMAKANYKKYLESGNDLRLKRHLYVGRALLYKNIVAETHEIPPLNFEDALDVAGEIGVCQNHEHDSGTTKVAKTLRHWAEDKRDGGGDKEFNDEPLHDWFKSELHDPNITEGHNVRGIEREKVNEFVRRVM